MSHDAGLRRALVIAICVGGGTILVLAATGAHKPWSRGPHHAWVSAAIAAVIVAGVTAVALTAAGRRRR